MGLLFSRQKVLIKSRGDMFKITEKNKYEPKYSCINLNIDYTNKATYDVTNNTLNIAIYDINNKKKLLGVKNIADGEEILMRDSDSIDTNKIFNNEIWIFNKENNDYLITGKDSVIYIRDRYQTKFLIGYDSKKNKMILTRNDELIIRWSVN